MTIVIISPFCPLPQGFEDFFVELLSPTKDCGNAESTNAGDIDTESILDLVRGFLMVYQSYTTPQELFRIWRKVFLESKSPINAASFLLEWLQRYGTDFNRDMINKSISIAVKNQLPHEISNQIKLLVLKAHPKIHSATEGHPSKRSSLPSPTVLPLPFVHKRSTSSLSLNNSGHMVIHQSTVREYNKKHFLREFIQMTTTFDPKEIAKSLTMREYNQLKKVSAREIVNNGWQSESKHQVSPNITLLIEMFNQVGYWVTTQILYASDSQKQILLLEKFISVAAECEKLSNYNGLLEILSGLNNVAVSRLTKLWESLGDKTKRKFEDLDRLMSSVHNYKLYRETIALQKGPFSPCISVLLRDATFITEANRPTINQEVNRHYLLLMRERAKVIERSQSKPYALETNPMIDTYVSNLDYLSNEKELYMLSKKWMSSQCR